MVQPALRGETREVAMTDFIEIPGRLVENIAVNPLMGFCLPCHEAWRSLVCVKRHGYGSAGVLEESSEALYE